MPTQAKLVSCEVASHADVFKGLSRILAPLNQQALVELQCLRTAEVFPVVAWFAGYSGARTRDEPLRTSAWEVSCEATTVNHLALLKEKSHIVEILLNFTTVGHLVY